MRNLRKLAVVGVITVVPVLGVAGVAAAWPSPTAPGQPATGGHPSISRQNYTTTPGNGSAAVSEYDIACYRQTVHDH